MCRYIPFSPLFDVALLLVTSSSKRPVWPQRFAARPFAFFSAPACVLGFSPLPTTASSPLSLRLSYKPWALFAAAGPLPPSLSRLLPRATAQKPSRLGRRATWILPGVAAPLASPRRPAQVRARRLLSDSLCLRSLLVCVCCRLGRSVRCWVGGAA
ncbi:hypothetical protein PVAP13_5KG461207 [Panicum virgatum]|uniref:Uncharacterized protein n=1 Tax=Panicum virgatum TaxID=38727 RepID=A0A8T0SQD5_PANVG|nr:hypothetical protein PVAP13_5KG461207 [Panicum virgatum]